MSPIFPFLNSRSVRMFLSIAVNISLDKKSDPSSA
nr:MAG TPA: hypothetical protein [Caudoviricetes sp.]